jgi:hypothetical protein
VKRRNPAQEPVFGLGRPKWWLWPTILSLDAPAVALVWQALLARVVGVRLDAHQVVLLGLSVWLAYAADRWIEGWRLTPQTVRTQRHAFFLRWRWPAFAVWLMVLLGAVGLAIARLNSREWVASLGLLTATLVYLLSHQLLHRHHPWRVPKEVCVAVIIALGAALYPAVQAPARVGELVIPLLLLSGLGLANCLLISVWDREVDAQHGQTSLALRFTWGHRLARGVLVGIAGLGAVLVFTASGAMRELACCATASAGLLSLLALTQRHLGRERARVLVDLGLLTPLVALALK